MVPEDYVPSVLRFPGGVAVPARQVPQAPRGSPTDAKTHTVQLAAFAPEWAAMLL